MWEGTNERPGTDHVISGPIRGLKKLHPMAQNHRQTDRHGNTMSESAQWGRFSEKLVGTAYYFGFILSIDNKKIPYY